MPAPPLHQASLLAPDCSGLHPRVAFLLGRLCDMQACRQRVCKSHTLVIQAHATSGLPARQEGVRTSSAAHSRVPVQDVIICHLGPQSPVSPGISAAADGLRPIDHSRPGYWTKTHAAGSSPRKATYQATCQCYHCVSRRRRSSGRGMQAGVFA